MEKSGSSRRRFLGWANGIVAGSGLAARSAEAADAQPGAEGEDYYDKLGVTKIINAAGTYTALTASIMPASVQAAVARAAKSPVRLSELQQKAGEYLAQKLRCEAALVSAGAASALTLGTAACITHANRAAASRDPHGYGWAEERGSRAEGAPLWIRPCPAQLRHHLRGSGDAGGIRQGRSTTAP